MQKQVFWGVIDKENPKNKNLMSLINAPSLADIILGLLQKSKHAEDLIRLIEYRSYSHQDDFLYCHMPSIKTDFTLWDILKLECTNRVFCKWVDIPILLGDIKVKEFTMNGLPYLDLRMQVFSDRLTEMLLTNKPTNIDDEPYISIARLVCKTKDISSAEYMIELLKKEIVKKNESIIQCNKEAVITRIIGRTIPDPKDKSFNPNLFSYV